MCTLLLLKRWQMHSAHGTSLFVVKHLCWIPQSQNVRVNSVLWDDQLCHLFGAHGTSTVAVPRSRGPATVWRWSLGFLSWAWAGFRRVPALRSLWYRGCCSASPSREGQCLRICVILRAKTFQLHLTCVCIGQLIVSGYTSVEFEAVTATVAGRSRSAMQSTKPKIDDATLTLGCGCACEDRYVIAYMHVYTSCVQTCTQALAYMRCMCSRTRAHSRVSVCVGSVQSGTCTYTCTVHVRTCVHVCTCTCMHTYTRMDHAHMHDHP